MIQALFIIFSSYFLPTPASYTQIEVTEIPLREVISDTTITLGGASGERGLVLIFFEKGCPYNKHYKQRLEDLVSSYKSAGFKFALITEKDSLKTGIKTDYIFIDKGKAIKNNLGAKKSPEVFLFSKSYSRLHVVYHGAIDNNPLDANNVSEAYLKEAMNNVISRKKQVEISTTPYGCYID